MSKRQLAKLIFAIGLLLIVASLGIVAFNIFDANMADKKARATEIEIEAQFQEMTPSFFDYHTDENGNVTEGSSGEIITEVPEMATMQIDGEEYLGTIEIPSLDIKLPVISDWDENKLKKSPCRYSGSYYTNDLVICGHNYQSGAHFGKLRDIEPNADIYFTTANAEIIHFKAVRGEYLEPDQVDEMVTRTDWDLTLYTCNTSGSERLTVRCVRA